MVTVLTDDSRELLIVFTAARRESARDITVTVSA
jgi:hypothetical protein